MRVKRALFAVNYSIKFDRDTEALVGIDIQPETRFPRHYKAKGCVPEGTSMNVFVHDPAGNKMGQLVPGINKSIKNFLHPGWKGFDYGLYKFKGG